MRAAALPLPPHTHAPVHCFALYAALWAPDCCTAAQGNTFSGSWSTCALPLETILINLRHAPGRPPLAAWRLWRRTLCSMRGSCPGATTRSQRCAGTVVIHYTHTHTYIYIIGTRCVHPPQLSQLAAVPAPRARAFAPCARRCNAGTPPTKTVSPPLTCQAWELMSEDYCLATRFQSLQLKVRACTLIP